VHQIKPPARTGQVTCLGWGLNFTDLKAVKAKIDSGPDVTLDDILSQAVNLQQPGLIPDLPAELAIIDMESSLPKLSILPSGGKDDDIFSSRASIDAMFHPAKKSRDDSVDVLVIGSGDGLVHLSIYDSFEVGSFDLRAIEAFKTGCQAILHASHSFSSTHSLLVETTTEEIYLVPLDLRFISSSGGYLSLLASKSTQLQNLLRYINQVTVVLENEFRSSQDLPGKFIRNINETLQEKCQCDLVHAAYHLVVTGNCYPPMKEWLVDELSERVC
jgi:anaphase-promoting complex subunit 4